MDSNQWDKVEEVAETIDDLKTTVDELKDEPPDDVEPQTIEPLKQALERATDAADAIENRKK
jgi:inosine/xanthosine triphosphate pyrophosphatase family protein